MQTMPSYHSQHYAAALDELSKAPVIALPPLLTFVASVFDVPRAQLMNDLLEWVAPVALSLAVTA